MSHDTINIEQAIDILVNIFKNHIRTVPLLIGDAGIGKSTAVDTVGAKLGWPVLNFRLAQISDVSDILGGPRFDVTTNSIQWYPPPWWKFVQEHPEGGILHFDELNRANNEIRQSIFQLLTDWKMLTIEVPHKWSIVASINPDSSGLYHVEGLDPALIRRLTPRLSIEADPESWCHWAEKNGVMPSIVSHIRKNPDQLCIIKENEPYPNPASWTKVSELIKYRVIDPDKLNDKINLAILTGVIGRDAAISFANSSFISFIDGKKILYSYDSIEEELFLQEDIAMVNTINSLANAIPNNVSQIEPKTVTNIKKFIKKLPKEKQALLLSQLVRDRDVFTTTFLAPDLEIQKVIRNLKV